jgi:hypothetical protein
MLPQAHVISESSIGRAPGDVHGGQPSPAAARCSPCVNIHPQLLRQLPQLLRHIRVDGQQQVVPGVHKLHQLRSVDSAAQRCGQDRRRGWQVAGGDIVDEMMLREEYMVY